MKEYTKIINKDSRKLSKYIKSNSIDFIVTSPPYWHLRNYGYEEQIGFKQEYDEYLESMSSVFKECYKVIKDGRFMAINIGTVVSNEGMKFVCGDFINLCSSIGWTFRKDIIWHKPKGQTKWQRGATQFSQNPYPLKYNTNINHEFILIFQKGDSLETDDSAKQKFSKYFVRKHAYSVWDIAPVNSPKKDEKHVAPFPEEIPERLINLFSFENETILDPFGGCGTTNAVAKKLGRKSIAVELSKDYCKLIKQKTDDVKFNSYEKDIYTDSQNYKLKLAEEKLKIAERNYIKAQKNFKKIMKTTQTNNQGTKKNNSPTLF